MEIVTESIKSVFEPEYGRISFFNKKDNQPLLLNASYSFSFGTEGGGIVSFSPDKNNSSINAEKKKRKIIIHCIPKQKSVPEFLLKAEVSPDGNGIEISSEIKNSTGTGISLVNFTLIEADCVKEGAVFPGRSPHEFVFFGYRSAPYDMLPEWILPEFTQHGKYSFFGDSVSAIADAEKRNALVFGFITYTKWWSKTSLRMRQIGFGFQRLRSLCRCDGAALAPGQSASSETLRIEYAGQIAQGLENWAARTAEATGCKKNFRIPTGWSTWDYYHSDINEKNILENVKFLAENRDRFPVEYIQIDAGFTDIYGDWLDWNKKSFPHGPKRLVDKIKSYGFKAGIWFVPTMVSDKSRVFKEHKEWFLKKGDGSLVYRDSGPQGKCSCYFLDTSIPEALKWIEEVGRSFVKDIGFEYIKTDGATNYALSEGIPQNRSETLFSAFRSAMEALRKGAGNETFLLHGGFVPSTAGIIDGNRVGYDIAARWSQPPEPYENKIEATRPFMPRILANIFNSWFVNNRLWKNDPDYLIVRENGGSAGDFTIDEAQLWATATALCSGPLILGDRMKNLPEKRLKILEKVFPAVECRMKPLDFCVNRIPHTIAAEVTDGATTHKFLAFFNHTEEGKEFVAEINEMGFAGSVHAHEFWSGTYQLSNGKCVSSGTMKPHSVKIFALKEKKNHPQIVGSDLHIFQGAELIHEKWNGKTKTLEVCLSSEIKQRRKIFIWVPAKYNAPAADKICGNEKIIEFTMPLKKHEFNIIFK
jgi:alpha-galactosidase